VSVSFPDVPVAILAGGLATRLRPLTTQVPKSLLPVAGRPFLAHQFDLLRRQGLRRVILCVGYLGEQIQEQFGDGRNHGIQIEYSFDGPVLLGTGGAVKRALPRLGDSFFVLYGDSYLPTDWRPVWETFCRSGRAGLMVVYHNEGRYDTSNVWFEQGEIKVYDKQNRLPQMQHIDYGLSILCPAAFQEYPDDQAFDLATVLQGLVRKRQLAGFEVTDRFYEIGSPSGLEELARLLGQREIGVTGS
jgi:NDP-sugar pyrophosphorylase family protein